ncbi:MFS transporter [Dactylosporangium sp. NPDC000521]|uniref:MFS transporter n=1 Tax=Dactylosporangium sp. NPDC000521 TaxID=3363975 RepID=UPI003674DE99
MSPYLQVLRHPVFNRVLPGLVLSALGDGMSAVAVGWLALQLAPTDARGLWVGLAVAAFTLPGAVGTVVFAPLLRDRGAALLVAWDGALRAVLLGAVALLSTCGGLSIGRYVTLLALSALLSAWGSAGRYTVIAQVLPAPLHLPANALLTAIVEASTVAGPAIAGLLIAFLGAPAALAVDAATFAVLAVSFLQIKADTPATGATGAAGGRSEGFAAIRRDPHLRGPMVLTFWFFLLFGPLPVAMPLFVSSVDEIGLVYMAFGAGAVIGAVVTGHLRRLALWPVMIGVVIAFGLLLMPLGLPLPLWGHMIALGLAGLAWAPYPTTSMSLVQRTVPAGRLPPVLAARGAVLVVATPLGTLLGAPLVQAVGAPATFAACGAATTVVGLVALAAQLRGRRRLGDVVQHVAVGAQPPGVLPEHVDRLVEVLGQHVGQVDEQPAAVDRAVAAHLERALPHPQVHAEVDGGPVIPQHHADQRERRLTGSDSADQLPVHRAVRGGDLLPVPLEILTGVVERTEQCGGATRPRVHDHPPAAR